jgi:hypothetical protein
MKIISEMQTVRNYLISESFPECIACLSAHTHIQQQIFYGKKQVGTVQRSS